MEIMENGNPFTGNPGTFKDNFIVAVVQFDIK